MPARKPQVSVGQALRTCGTRHVSGMRSSPDLPKLSKACATLLRGELDARVSSHDHARSSGYARKTLPFRLQRRSRQRAQSHRRAPPPTSAVATPPAPHPLQATQKCGRKRLAARACGRAPPGNGPCPHPDAPKATIGSGVELRRLLASGCLENGGVRCETLEPSLGPIDAEVSSNVCRASGEFVLELG